MDKIWFFFFPLFFLIKTLAWHLSFILQILLIWIISKLLKFFFSLSKIFLIHIKGEVALIELWYFLTLLFFPLFLFSFFILVSLFIKEERISSLILLLEVKLFFEFSIFLFSYSFIASLAWFKFDKGSQLDWESSYPNHLILYSIIPFFFFFFFILFNFY